MFTLVLSAIAKVALDMRLARHKEAVALETELSRCPVSVQTPNTIEPTIDTIKED